MPSTAVIARALDQTMLLMANAYREVSEKAHTRSRSILTCNDRARATQDSPTTGGLLEGGDGMLEVDAVGRSGAVVQDDIAI